MTAFQFELQNGAVCKVHPSTGAVVTRHEPIGTKVVQVLPKDGLLIIREDYYQFPAHRSNVYCLDQDFAFVWAAELPIPTDVFSGGVIDKGETLECTSWEGFTCQVDPASGRIVRAFFTK